MLSTMLFAFLLFTQLYRLLSLCCHNCRMSCDRIRCCCCCRCIGTCQRTQHDLNNLYTGTEFPVARSYQMLHVVTWITMTFSTTMPMLYGMAFLFYFLKFYLDKYLVLGFHRRPHTFDEQLSQEQVWYFKWPIIMHVVFSIASLSSNQMFFEAKLQSEHLGVNPELL